MLPPLSPLRLCIVPVGQTPSTGTADVRSIISPSAPAGFGNNPAQSPHQRAQHSSSAADTAPLGPSPAFRTRAMTDTTQNSSSASTDNVLRRPRKLTGTNKGPGLTDIGEVDSWRKKSTQRQQSILARKKSGWLQVATLMYINSKGGLQAMKPTKRKLRKYWVSLAGDQLMLFKASDSEDKTQLKPVCVCVCVCVCAYTYVCTYVCGCGCGYTNMCVCMCPCRCTCVWREHSRIPRYKPGSNSFDVVRSCCCSCIARVRRQQKHVGPPTGASPIVFVFKQAGQSMSTTLTTVLRWHSALGPSSFSQTSCFIFRLVAMFFWSVCKGKHTQYEDKRNKRS